MERLGERSGWTETGHLPGMADALVRWALAAAAVLALLSLTACGRGGKMTEDMLPGGIPARTNLHRASNLPQHSVRTVSRKDFGWRLIYHPAAAPPDADQRAAAALCGLESKRAAQIVHQPLDAPFDDPGARKIDIHCG